MKVFTQSVNFNADKKLIIYADEKVLGLVKYHDKIVDAEVFLKVLNISDKENKLTEIKINIPIQGEGVRGLIIGDPCYSSEFIICAYKDKFNILNHLTTLINAINFSFSCL